MTRSTLFFAALAATVSHPAFAAEIAQTTEVRYADLDLASSDGAQTLRTRVERAAKRVCNLEGDKSLDGAMKARNCTKVAIARAMPQVELALTNAGTQVAENSRLSVAAH